MLARAFQVFVSELKCHFLVAQSSANAFRSLCTGVAHRRLASSLISDELTLDGLILGGLTSAEQYPL